MSNQSHKEDKHEAAFKAWFETRTFARVVQTLGVSHSTAKNWASATFQCPHGCPWHDWDRLAIEHEKALAARLAAYEQGDLDPVLHATAVPDAVPYDPSAKASTDARRRVVGELVRSDLERAAHWELLYAMAFYQLTGVALPGGKVYRNGREVDAKEVYDMGRKIVSFEGGMKAMINAQEQIDNIKERLGIHKQQADARAEAPKNQVDMLTIEDARRMQELLANSSPEHLELIKKLMKADENALRVLVNEPVAAPVEVIPPTPPNVPDAPFPFPLTTQ